MKVKKSENKVLWQWKVMMLMAYFIVLIVPLYFSTNSQLFPFSSPKTLIIMCMTIIMTILYFWGLLSSKNLVFRFTSIHIALVVFLFILTLSSILGIDPLNSFFGRWRESISLLLIYALAVFSLLIGFLAKMDKEFLVKVLLFSFISSVMVALISFTNGSLVYTFRDGSTTIGNSSYAGAYLLFNTCFGIGLFFYYSKIWHKILTALSVIIVSFSPLFFNKDILLGSVRFHDLISNPILLFGYANAATIGLGISVIVIFIFFLIFSSKKSLKILGSILLFCLFLNIYYVSNQLVKPNSRIHNVYVEAKGENRFLAWDIAQKNFAEKPLLGSGFNNFSYTYQKNFNRKIAEEKDREFYFNQPHNVILEYSSNTGVFGLMAFLSLLFCTFLAFFYKKDDEDKRYVKVKIVLIGALFGYFIQNLFGFDTPVTYLMLFFVVGLAMGESKKEWLLLISNKYHNLIKFLASLAIIICMICMVLFVILPLKEISDWNKVISLENTKERVLIMGKMQDVSLLGGVSDSAYLAGKVYNVYTSKLSEVNDKNRDLALNEIDAVIGLLDKDIRRQPYDVDSYLISSHLLNMKLYLNKKLDDETWNKSYKYALEANKLNPNSPDTDILIAQTLILKNDFDNGYKYIRQAIEVAPGYIESYIFAKKILDIKPNKDFEKYVNDMKSRWILNSN